MGLEAAAPQANVKQRADAALLGGDGQLQPIVLGHHCTHSQAGG
ncbi:hypothetical protein P308_12330 [Pseudomonas piscis]|nr:hypothetical protein P308_12330 [Pseudomonas piscis]